MALLLNVKAKMDMKEVGGSPSFYLLRFLEKFPNVLFKSVEFAWVW